MRSPVVVRSSRTSRTFEVLRPSSSRRTSKQLALFLAALLMIGLLPASALAAPQSLLPVPEGGQGTTRIASSVEGGAEEVSHRSSDDPTFADAGSAATSPENVTYDDEPEDTGHDIASSAVIARKESAKSYFLVQTLGSTRTVPVVNAELTIDAEASCGSSSSVKGEDRVRLNTMISSESTVVGSFSYRGIVYAIEPGGHSVAVVAVDPSKLPSDLLEARTIVLPSQVSFDGIDSYSVSRICDGAFASLASPKASVPSASSEGDDPRLKGAATSEAPAIEEDLEDMIEIDDALSCETAEDEAPLLVDENGGTGALMVRDSIEDIAFITIPASVNVIEAGALSDLEALRGVIVSDDNRSYSMQDGRIRDETSGDILFALEEEDNVPTASLRAVYGGSYVVERGEKLELASNEGATYAFSNDILESTDEGLFGLAAGTTELFVMSSSEKGADIYCTTVAVSADAEEIHELAGQGQTEEGIFEQVEGNARTYETVSLQNADRDINEQFEFIKTGEGTCAIQATEGVKLEGAVILPMTGVIKETGEVCLVTSISDGEEGGSTGKAFCNQVGITSISIPSTIESIGSLAFYGCTNLRSLSLPEEGDLHLGYNFLSGCASLSDLHLAAAVTSIDVDAFRAASVASFTVSENNLSFRSIEGVLYDKSGTTLLKYPGARPDAELTIPSSTTSIGQTAFMASQNLKTLYIPASVTRIGYQCFRHSSVTTIYCYGMPTFAQNQLWYGGDGNANVTVYCPEAAVDSWRGLHAAPKAVIPILEGWAVIFFPNGSDVLGVMGTVLTPNDAVVFEPKAPRRNGYTFDGWYYGEEATGGPYDFSRPVTGNFNLYAKWTLNTYAVSYHEGDPSTTGSGKTETYTVESTPFSIGAPERVGYVFEGWMVTLEDEGTGRLAANDNGSPNVLIMPGSNKTYGDLAVTALWKPKTYQMVFDVTTLADAHWKEGEDPSEAYEAIEYDSDVAFPKAVPVRNGWRFSYWARTDAPDGKMYRPEDGFMTAPNFHSEQDAVARFEAHWTQNLQVMVPLGSQNVGMKVSADLTGDHPFKVDKGIAEIINLSDGELEVVSVGEDTSDPSALAARKNSALEAFGGPGADPAKLDAISFVLTPTSDGMNPDATKERAEFALYGSYGMTREDWRLAARTDPLDASATSTLQVLYDLAFDYSKIGATDLKIGLDMEPISQLIYTLALVDVIEPNYEVPDMRA